MRLKCNILFFRKQGKVTNLAYMMTNPFDTSPPVPEVQSGAPVNIRGTCRRTYLSTQNGIIVYAKRNSAREVAFDMPTNVGPTYGMYVGPTSYQCYTSNMSYVGATYVGATLRQHVGPTSKLTLGQRSLSTLGQRSGQPKYSVGPTLSCYLGKHYKLVLIMMILQCQTL